MVIKFLEKIKVPNNSEVGACKRIFSNRHGQNFFNSVAYLSCHVTKIFQKVQVKNKKNFGTQR